MQSVLSDILKMLATYLSLLLLVLYFEHLAMHVHTYTVAMYNVIVAIHTVVTNLIQPWCFTAD